MDERQKVNPNKVRERKAAESGRALINSFIIVMQCCNNISSAFRTIINSYLSPEDLLTGDDCFELQK